MKWSVADRIVATAAVLAALSLAVEYGAGYRSVAVAWIDPLLVGLFVLAGAPGALRERGVWRWLRALWPAGSLALALALREAAHAHYALDDPATAGHLADALRPAVVARVALLVLGAVSAWRRARPRLLDAMMRRPIGAFLATLGLLVSVGTAGLALPGAARHGAVVPLGDAGYLAVSAVSLTGATPVVLADTLSRWGQFVLIAIVQLAALTVLGFGAAFWVCATGRTRGELERMLRVTAAATAIVELAGAAALFARLPRAEFSLYTRAFVAGFHSVSAFCNAGFSIYRRGMAPFYADWDISLLIGGLVFLGGLGIFVFGALAGLVRGPLPRRIAAGSIALLLLGAASLYAAGGLTGLEAIFESFNCRSAGFATAGFPVLGPAALAVTAVLMFVGGAPGSVAGGVKITTLMALCTAAVRPAWRRSPAARAAAAVAATGVFAILLGVVLLWLTETAPVRAVVFQAVSAFGTVGLSLDQTPSFTTSGRYVLVALMMLGRTAPMIVGLAVYRHYSGSSTATR